MHVVSEEYYVMLDMPFVFTAFSSFLPQEAEYWQFMHLVDLYFFTVFGNQTATILGQPEATKLLSES